MDILFSIIGGAILGFGLAIAVVNNNPKLLIATKKLIEIAESLKKD
jgi:hypothetical protein